MSPPETAGPSPISPPRAARSGPSSRTVPRAELLRRPGFAQLSPEVGVLDENAFTSALAADPDAALTLLVELRSATDERLRAAARALARRVVLDRARRGRLRRSGVSRLRTRPADRGGELDVEASIGVITEARAAGRPPAVDDLLARDWGRPELALCLVVDASGSMSGERLAAAALTAAACAVRAPGDHAVLSFAQDVSVLRRMDSMRSAEAVVDAVLNLRGHGVTALAAALRAAGEQVSLTRAARRVVVLLSDCRATDQQDPLQAAVALSELLVLAPADDSDAAQDLARRSGARWRPLPGPAAAPELLATLLE